MKKMMKTTQMSGILMIKAWIFKAMTDPFRVDGLINAMKHLGKNYPPGKKFTYPTVHGKLGTSSTQKFHTGGDMLVPRRV